MSTTLDSRLIHILKVLKNNITTLKKKNELTTRLRTARSFLKLATAILRRNLCELVSCVNINRVTSEKMNTKKIGILILYNNIESRMSWKIRSKKEKKKIEKQLLLIEDGSTTLCHARLCHEEKLLTATSPTATPQRLQPTATPNVYKFKILKTIGAEALD